MTDKKKNGWVKFVPSLDLPKERVSIAYDTHDERGVRYAYGYFQFYNGTCGCFWKDGNEQPTVIKAEDIKYWMPIPSLDMQEETVNKELHTAYTKVKEKKLSDKALDFIVETQEENDYICEQMVEGAGDYCVNNCQNLNRHCVKLFLEKVYKKNK